jgi:hypothetical protein
MTDYTPGTFRLLDHLGNVVASGGSTQALAPLPDSTARKQMMAEWAQYKADAAEARLQQQRANEAQVRAICNDIARFGKRLDAFELRHADRKRRDAEAEAQREKQAIADMLARLPDADNPARIH